MAQQFKFNILTGTDAQSKYDAITTKEPFTFYLLQTGVGYLGEKKLFDAASLENTEVTLTGKFFRAVASHVVTQADLDNANMSKPDGTVVGDAGILFTADNNETDDGDEHQYFVPVKIPNTIAAIDGDNPGNDIPTATAVVNYVTQILGGYVTFEIDGTPGTATSDGGICYPGVYSTDEVRIGTWIDGKPLYRKVINGNTCDNASPLTIGTIPNLDKATTITGVVYTDSSMRPIYYSGTSDKAIGLYIGTDASLILWTTDSSMYSLPVVAIIEYTKTTDNGGT